MGRIARLMLVLVPLMLLAGVVLVGCGNPPSPPTVAVQPASAIPDLTATQQIEVGGRKLFAGWPKDKPDLVLMITGQTFGYLSPCGCSSPQTGGLERRFNVMQSVRAKGWDIIGVDVGDNAPIPQPNKTVPEQALKKYTYVMKSLQAMGYVAVGVGKTEFQNDITKLLGQFTLNNEGKRPIVLSSNILGGVERDKANPTTVKASTPRAEYFKVPNQRPLVEDVELVTDKAVSVGVVGVMGASTGKEIAALYPDYDFEPVAVAIPRALNKLNSGTVRPELKVLLLQGDENEAQSIAKDYPEFQVIVCTSAESEDEAPLLPKYYPVNQPRTQIIRMGHKGKNAGLLGIFKTPTGLDLRYQLVPLGEEFLTPRKPVDLAKENSVLQLLERYTGEVRDEDYLAGYTDKVKVMHPVAVMIGKADTKYIGSVACAKCHAAEYKKWSETKHSHAYEALEKYATRPSLRQFDPECVVCHTVGFEYKTGFESKKKTPELLNNGCENCHGPGSAHAAKPKDIDLLKALSPWKLNPKDKLPSLAELEKIAAVPEGERGRVQIDNGVRRLAFAIDRQVCRKCHDGDNDPKFDIFTYMPKVYHSNLKDDGLPGK